MRGLLTLIAAVLLLTACSEIEAALGTNKCSRYNGSKDSFRIEFDYRWWLVEPGNEFTADYSASWTDDYYVRKDLDCLVDWQVDDAAIVEHVSGTKHRFEVLDVGFTRVSAVVTGSTTKTAEFEVVSLPPVTEVEPNNGTASANPIAENGSVMGQLDYDDDIDYFSAHVPAGASFQFTLRFPIDLSRSTVARTPTYSSAVLAPDGGSFGDVNRTYTNDTGADATYYVRVQPNTWNSSFTNPMYEISFDLFD